MLSRKKVLHFCQYAAPYEGNFLKSLLFLEESLKMDGCSMAFVFPQNAVEQSWWHHLSKYHVFYTTNNNPELAIPEIREILMKEKPDLIHTHFDGYDVPVVKALLKQKKIVPVIWHLHDSLHFHPNCLKKIYQFFHFVRHYCWYARIGVSVIGVNPQILSFVEHIKRLSGRYFPYSVVIPNGIDMTRISVRRHWTRKNPFTFLAFGGRNIDKRIDLLFEAASLVYEKHKIKVLVTQGVDTLDLINQKYGNQVPEWLSVIPQQDDVTSIFDMADCFVSTSVHETFSYAICEATIYGLPIIQSDIEGTKWNAKNPSTFIFQSENVEALRFAMEQVLMSNPIILKENCENTSISNRNLYSMDNWAEKVIAFYKQLSI